MTTTTVGFDYAMLPGAKGNVSLRVDERARRIIGGAARDLLAENPGAGRGDVARLSHRLWEQVRHIVIDDRGRTVETELQRPEVGGPIELQSVMKLLIDAGDLERALERQIHELQAQLAALRGERE